MATHGVSSSIISTRAVDDPILESKEFGDDALLPVSMKALISKLSEAALVSDDSELLELQIRTPLLDG